MLSTITASASFADFPLGGGEVILVLALVLILVAAKKIPELVRGLGDGLSQFRRNIKQLDREAHEAGESLGGIYGKPAAQALTPDNKVAELYDPIVFRRHHTSKNGPLRRFLRLCGVIWRRLCRGFSAHVRSLASWGKWR